LAGGELLRLSFDAHRDRPRLRTHDRFGHRLDLVEFHPNYHAVMAAAIEHGVAGLSWHGMQSGSHLARAALSYLHGQVEPGSSCPLTMTHAAVPGAATRGGIEGVGRQGLRAALRSARRTHRQQAWRHARHGHDREAGWQRCARQHDAGPSAAGADEYTLVGHKWFFSAPMSDGFLVLAQAPGGLTCFLMPRWRPDWRRNAFRLMRLKDKLGDWSNASSEVEFDGAWAHRLGDEGRGSRRPSSRW
jgi:putative acyl-CoA dehydrogenase